MAEKEDQEVELPLDTAGTLLTRAREAAGKTRVQVSEKTKISDRQLAAIEAGNYSALPSRAYAVGFARTYAKEVGLDGNAIVAMVRDELDEQMPQAQRRAAPVFEPGDPARLPGAKVAWIAAAGLAAVLLIGFLVWPSLYAPGGTLPSILPEESASPAASAVLPIAPAAVSAGPVVFTATRDKVWVKFVDGAGQQLLQKELAKGESWTVPEGVAGVRLTTARPDGLALTIGGRAVAPLSETDQLLSNVPVTVAALLARGTSAAAPAAPATTPAVAPAATVISEQRPALRPARQRQSVPGPDVEPTLEPVPAAVPPAAPSSATAGTTTADS
jgi:cytoskeleton protein RodZ